MPSNSFILSTTTTIGEYALLKSASWMNQRFTGLILQKDFKHKINIKCLFYYFHIISKFCKENLNTSSFPSVDMKALKTLQIPFPPLSQQQK